MMEKLQKTGVPPCCCFDCHYSTLLQNGAQNSTSLIATIIMDLTNHLDMDDLELEAVGYRREMPRQFTMVSFVALSFTLTCTWSGTGSSMGISLLEASSAGTLWSLPVAALMTAIVSLGMAELASTYPVAGAQYYWSFMVASDKYKAFAAYL